jgi:hypothetical protein
MRLFIRVGVWSLVFVWCLVFGIWSFGAERSPDIIFILADDPGYGDIGPSAIRCAMAKSVS